METAADGVLPSNVDDPRFVSSGKDDPPAEWTAADAVITELTFGLDDGLRRRHFVSLILDLLEWLLDALVRYR